MSSQPDIPGHHPRDMVAAYANKGNVPQPIPRQTSQPRKKPMQVLCLGLSRTGTLSLYIALRELGYNSYHACEMALNKANEHTRLWREAVDAKYLGGKHRKLESAQDFDQILWDYEAIADVPCVLFADELVRAYPDAKVVLTERDPDSWVRSIESVFYHILQLKIWKVLQVIDTGLARDYIPLLRSALHVWTSGDINNRQALKTGFITHNAHIKSTVLKDRLLVFHPHDGWEPLCKHLGKPVPKTPYPKVNVGNVAAINHEWLFARDRLIVVGRKVVKVVVPVGVAVVAVWWGLRGVR